MNSEMDNLAHEREKNSCEKVLFVFVSSCSVTWSSRHCRLPRRHKGGISGDARATRCNPDSRWKLKKTITEYYNRSNKDGGNIAMKVSGRAWPTRYPIVTAAYPLSFRGLFSRITSVYISLAAHTARWRQRQLIYVYERDRPRTDTLVHTRSCTRVCVCSEETTAPRS